MSDYYTIWQEEKFGNVLPAYDNPLMPVDHDEQSNSDAIDEERKMIAEEENWIY